MSDSSWGSFGTNVNTEPQKTEKTEKEKRDRRERDERERDPRERVPKKKTRREGYSLSDFLSEITPETWVDIVCCTFIAVFLIVIACNWAKFSEWLFLSILFPIIDIGAKIVLFVAIVAIIVVAILLWFRSRTRRRWW